MLKGLSEKSNESNMGAGWTDGGQGKKAVGMLGAVLGILERNDHTQVQVALTTLVGVCLSN